MGYRLLQVQSFAVTIWHIRPMFVHVLAACYHMRAWARLAALVMPHPHAVDFAAWAVCMALQGFDLQLP